MFAKEKDRLEKDIHRAHQQIKLAMEQIATIDREMALIKEHRPGPSGAQDVAWEY
jgi:hypothetical protein